MTFLKRIARSLVLQFLPGVYRARAFRSAVHTTRADVDAKRTDAELALLPALLARRPRTAFIDVGANAGAYIAAASAHIPEERVYAIEPQMTYVKDLKQLFPKVHTFAAAFSDHTGVSELKVPSIKGNPYPTRGTLESFKEEEESGATFEKVSVMRLDDFVAHESVGTVGVIKIDVEGHERAALEGAKHTLMSQHPTLIVEIEARHHTGSIDEIFAFICGLGYEGWFYEHATGAYAPLAQFSVEKHQARDAFKSVAYINNFVFLPLGEKPPLLRFAKEREDSTCVVLALPRTIPSNPYFDLLYGGIDGHESGGLLFRVEDFSFSRLFELLLSRQRVLVHIHWETKLYGSQLWLYSIARMCIKFPLLFLARIFGAKIVWTMHNRFAHEYPHPTIDAFGRMVMWRLADLVIVQNEGAARELARLHVHARVVFIPHGNYVGVYGSRADERMRASVREAFGFESRDCVLLALGSIRPYKRLPALASLVRELSATQPHLKLLIAGKGSAGELEALSLAAEGSPSVRIADGFVKDEDIPRLFAATDYSVFSYDDSSLTSGALLLSLSYGVPALLAHMPASELIQEGINGYVADSEGLAALLARLSTLSRPSSERVIESVADLDWDTIGAKTCSAFASLSI